MLTQAEIVLRLLLNRPKKGVTSLFLEHKKNITCPYGVIRDLRKKYKIKSEPQTKTKIYYDNKGKKRKKTIRFVKWVLDKGEINAYRERKRSNKTGLSAA